MDVDKFVRSVKLKYKERRLNREKQWPPCKSEKLVRLELVQSEGQSTTQLALTRGRDLEDKEIKRIPLAYSDLFKAERGKKQVRKVLVDGDAGIGKTTLCTALSEDWGNEKLFTQFRLLLLLPLRQKRVASASSLSELLSLLHSSEAIRTAVASYMEEGEGENVLIVADGWDELGEVERREGSFLYELLFGEQFCLMSVLVTSRPSASGPLHRLPCIDRFVEVRGFNKDNIKEYIQCEFDSEEAKASGLLEELESNPIVESVCSVPLNCAILCHLWRTLEGALPTTMTELYTKIIMNVILRNISKIPEYSQVMSLSQYDALPESLQQWWWCLCELAFRALEKDKIVFTHEEFDSFLPQGLPFDDKVLCFGLLQRCESILEIGLGVSFHFLHLTFQEYLAALYLARQSPDTQVQCCSSLALAPRFNVVWRFFFGITKFSSTASLTAQKEIISHITDDLTLYHCSFEAQGTSICAEIQEYSNRYYGVIARSSYDCSAIIHVIANTEGNNDMNVSFSHCAVGDRQIRALADALASKKGALQVRQLHLDGNMLSDGCVSYLFLKAFQSFLSLVELDLSQNRIGSEGVKSALAVLSRSSVGGEGVSFFIYDNPLGISGMNELRNAIVMSNGHLMLNALVLAGSLTDNEHTNAEWLHSFEQSLSKSILRSGELSLSRNRLGILGAKVLGKIIPQSFSIPRDMATPGRCFYLELSESMLGDEGVAAFTESIAGVCVFSLLDLSSNNIHAAGLKHLASGIHQRRIGLVHHLHLVNNPLRLEGVLALYKMLQYEHCSAQAIHLSGCELTTTENEDAIIDPLTFNQPLTCTNVGQWLCEQLKVSSVHFLFLDNNSFRGERVHILVGFMSLCPCLEHLICTGCDIASDDLKELLVQVSEKDLHMSNLSMWSLGNNDIDDDGVSALLQHLQLFPKFINISLINNSRASHGMLSRLEEELQRRSQEHKKYDDIMPGSYLVLDPHSQEFKTQWEVIVTHLYQLAMDPTFEPIFSTRQTPLRLEVVGESHDHRNTQGVVAHPCTSVPPNISEDDDSASNNPTCGKGGEIVAAQNESKLFQYQEEGRNDRTTAAEPPDLLPITHHLVDLIQWKDETGKVHQLKIYSETAHRWSHVATRLGFSHGRIENLWSDYRRNYDRLAAVLGEWFDNATCLPNAHLYPLSWDGLVRLLNDCGLSEVANKLTAALDSPSSNVRGNLLL